jgi:type I restriction enzyme S subunit
MNKTIATKKVPELRFPDFEDEWVIYSFENIAQRRKEKYNPKNSGEKFECVELESIDQRTGMLLNTFNSRNLKSTKNIFYEEDILFGKLRPYLRKYLFADFKGVCSSEIWVLFHKKGNNRFLYYLIQTDRFNYKASNTIGSKMPRADWKALSKQMFSKPSLPEQQKIADFLSQVDKKIELLSQKETALREYKKGVMQKLFSQEIRFKIKNDAGELVEPPDWEEKRLGDLLDYQQPTKFIVDSTEYDDSYNTPVITAGKTFLLGYTNEDYNVYKDWPVIIFDDFTLANHYVEFDFKVKSSAMKILRPAKKSVDIKYIYERMQLINFQKGDEHKRFWISEYSKLKIDVPCIEEQTKIANFLSRIDEKIEAVAERSRSHRQWKKGLLQKMFV